ncbi:MAG TPA: CBS domain-containing protein [Salinarimonas sp.]|jgi:CBS domain-containing protein|nr:CBS domain-containing protein [Salinarimonas sp.]
MTVQHILAEKGPEVVTIPPDRTLADAARTLSERRIGAVVVASPDQPVAGILSERDIVRALARSGAAALEGSVRDHMTREVVTCERTMLIPEVMEVMTSGKFRHLPVVEDGRLIGIVSIGDVVKHRLAQVESEQRAMRDYIAS